jgi:hypothetical protein
MNYDIKLVSADSAIAWLEGKFFVGDSLAESQGISFFPPQVVFVNHMGDDKLAALKRIRDLGDLGGAWIVAHVASSSLRTALEARGMVVDFTESIFWRGEHQEAWRMRASPDAFKQWLAELDRGILDHV